MTSNLYTRLRSRRSLAKVQSAGADRSDALLIVAIGKPTVFYRNLSENDSLDIASYQKEAKDQERADDGHNEREIMSSVRGVVEV